MDKNSLCYILRCSRCCKSSLKAVFEQKTNHQSMGWAPWYNITIIQLITGEIILIL